MKCMPQVQSKASRRGFLKGVAVGALSLEFSPSLFAVAMAPSPDMKTLILGGTAFALGAALANPGRCVVIERGIHLAPEFSQVGDWGEVGEAKTKQGAEMLSAMAAAGLVSDGRLELPALSDFLHAYFSTKNVALFFNAELVSFDRSGRAVVFGGGSAGLCRVAAGRMLDTTDIGWRDRGLRDVANRRFSAISSSGLVSVELPSAADRRAGRIRLQEAIASGRQERAILAECNEMGTSYRQDDGGRIARTFDDGTRWIPSAQFKSFITAFEEGLKCTLA